MKRLSLLAVAVGLLAATCSHGTAAFPEGAVAIRASNDLGVGRERLVVGVSMPDGRRLGSPDDPVTFAIAPEDDPTATRRYRAGFDWIIPNVNGVYRAMVEFDRPGIWNVTVVPDDGARIAPTAVQVQTDPFAPAIGEPAPVVATPTLADTPLADLTTDPDPDPDLYRISLDEAIAGGRPTVVVFATPAFCRTAACGPMLAVVKEVAPRHPEVNFVHVEVYRGFHDPGFAPDAAHLAPAVVAFDLPSEPWVFVIDAQGRVAARFEGALAAAELEDALR